jgi:serine protease inhibitor
MQQTKIILAAKREIKISIYIALKNIDNIPNIRQNMTLERHINMQGK